jgi:hypothetical protein
MKTILNATGEASNSSGNPALTGLIDRRKVLAGGLALMAGGFFRNGRAQDGPSRKIPACFKPIAPSFEDRVRVPEGYAARVLCCWGDPIGSPDGSPPFKADASNPPKDQLLQFGMNFDGMSFFPLPAGSLHPTSGLLCVNHEYSDRGLLHPLRPGFAYAPEQVEKEMAAHGVTVCEIALVRGSWRVRRPSAYARRVTGDSKIRIGGPARGHRLMRTAFDPDGETVRGTLNNCANGVTPWGTFLTCEENFNGYFSHWGLDPDLRRYGLLKSEYGWAKAGPDGGVRFERFDANRHPHEPNRFGWVVEIDPYDPGRPPVKRTALGRFRHENAAVVLAADGRVVVYMGDDQAFEYVYKFVSSGRYDAARPREAHLDLLDSGTLYAARFEADGSGRWLPLTTENPALRGFSDPGEILVQARKAADFAGATPLDRPEWIAVDPRTRRVYCAMTNNARREEPGPASPRPRNDHGHVVRWAESDPASDRFSWDVFLLAGDPESSVETQRAVHAGDVFSSPDGLSFDSRGLLWIQTDMSGGKMFHPDRAPDRPDFEAFGNNQMLAVDPEEGVVRRFLTGPVGCEVTGFTLTPDGRTLFVNIQHPGEPLDEKVSTSDPAQPARFSSWPYGGRPRSGAVVITKDDGGLIGT